MMDSIEVRAYREEDLPGMLEIWNEVVREGNAFPQEEFLDETTGRQFFASQSYTAVALSGSLVVGLYILHPNNIGRCSHIANASYAVSSGFRGMHAGRLLVLDSLRVAASLGFRILQFNAVVRSNMRARKLYEELGFHPLGIISGGFRRPDGEYEDICPYWRELR